MTEHLIDNKSHAKQVEELDKKHYLHPTTIPKKHVDHGPKLTFSNGHGIYVHDTKKETYIDGISMLWNVHLGHGQKELADAAHQQMSTLAYSSSFAGYSNEPAVLLAEKLAALAPGDLNSVFYTSGGSESNDTAFKLSRFYWQLKNQPQKTKIIALEQSYHGVTIAGQSATHLSAFHNFSGSSINGVFHAKPHVTECEKGNTSHPEYEGCIRDIVEKEGADTIAAVIIEPVQGSGGVHMPPADYMEAVRDLCNEFNIHMIADEIICGFGRTGKMFGVDNWNVVPDIMCTAKGITSGYSQLGAVLLHQDIRDTLVQYEEVLAHGFTYSGHPTACAVALKNLEIMERDHIVDHTKTMEKHLLQGLGYLKEKHSMVGKTRALGLLGGFEIFADSEKEIEFDSALSAAAALTEECFTRKLILRPLGAGVGKNIIAIAPPLIISKDEIEKMIGIIDDSLSALSKKLNV
ncbi:aminotransferase family protein [Alteribacillus bidgolensis]|uniref:Putrescine aminotransferase n=1 Tax=Alteribacillus bidgolensis TaxID=930129 RepID=A0A1G8NM26_9BACI|nr:aminotransferase class III-fold pyridoxal phosphate-dependent enzyme [Alteribacillus bidgolensis]SDI81046.1 putrescine aminotransferase [Alteribacillus bidgolensis]